MLDTIKEKATECTLCELHKSRKVPVFSKGNQDADILICGMCPGPDENKPTNTLNAPFVGTAGKLLDTMLEEAGLSMEDVYITNAVKCFVKPGIRLEQDWITRCFSYLIVEIQQVNPKVIVTLGKDALIALLDIDDKLALGELRKNEYSFCGIKVVPTYHPSYFSRKGGVSHKDYHKGIEDLKKAASIAQR